jgi:hypothetical protein
VVVRPDYAKASDAELLEAADAEAFAVLYDRHVGQLFAWARTRVGEYAADLTAELRALVASGQARVEASTTLDGVPAYKLSVSGASDRFLNGTAYVAQSDYYPLEIDTTGNGGERIVVQRYEYLPATPANLALLR